MLWAYRKTPNGWLYAHRINAESRAIDVGHGLTNLGRRIQDLRTHQDLSLSQLAEATGVSRSYLSNIENGLRSPSLEILDRVAEELGLLVSELLDGVPPYGKRSGRSDRRGH